MNAKILLSVIMSTVLLLVPCSFAKQATHDPLALFKNELEQDGFGVTPGSVAIEDWAAAYCAYESDSAKYYSNEPYLKVLVPQPDSEPSEFFQLDPDEAVVLIGLTPPLAKYFSYTPILMQKMYPDGMYPDGNRHVFASLGDPVNNATVKTIGSTPFNSPVALIFTPDQGTDAHVRAALRRAGYPAAIINTVVFPASMLTLGISENADWLKIGLRNAIWLTDEGEDYIDNPPLSVFRVTPLTPATANPFPVPPLRVRGTGQTEMELMNKLDDLRKGIIDANPSLDATHIVLNPMCYEGYDLIQRGIELCGDDRDAFYLGVGMPEWDEVNQITLADDEFLMVYGVNHVATRKATYMNINVYASETAKMTIGHLDDSAFQDTAKPYLPPGDPDANLMYAYKISRRCEGEPNCLELSVDDCTRLTIDSSTLLGIFTRLYLEPATKIGPALTEILYGRLIKFSPQP